MIELNGKYSNAYIYADIIDEETYGQIIKVINSPVSENSKLAIMADCHAGAGCVIGTTMLIKTKVCPNLVGVDIGCGMLTIMLGKLNFTSDDFKRFDECCNNVPSGYAIHNTLPEYGYEDYEKPLDYFKRLHCYKRLSKVYRLVNSLGTLGGGNHFIELDIDEEGNYYLVIHSGSRNLGKQVCEYYQALANKKCNNHTKEINELIKKLKQENKEEKINCEIEKLKKSFPKVSSDLAYLEEEEMEQYIDDLKICQEFAHKNRLMIAMQILMNFFGFNKISRWNGLEFNYATSKDNRLISGKGKLKAFETIHNYIDLDSMILRKGAVSAKKDEKLLIPINMRDGSLICIGKGNSDYNYSAPHGAGRIMSRSQAKDLVNLEEYIDTMRGIYTTSVSTSTIDEAPFVYKPIESILENIKETVDVIKFIKPIYNFKASDTCD